MLNDEVIERVVTRLANRIEQANEYVLREIGRSIKQIGTFNPSKANQLVNVLKYGGDYNKIVNKLAKITNMNVRDIYTIFDEVAKSDYNFSKQFYKYRNKPFVPYAKNIALRSQVRALADITAKEYINLTRTQALGFGLVDDETGKITFKGLQQTYYDLLDEAVLSVSQGKETFDSAMHRQLKNIGESGLKVIYDTTYIDKKGIERHYTRRLDSAVSMNMKSALRNLHNETQKQIGEGFGADMIEISVHSHPAPDHLMQGHQFMIEEFNKLQNGEEAKDLKGRKYTLDHDENGSYRPISEMSCYHYVFYGIAGISKPEYNEEELQKIIDENNEGFTFENKHYTLYDGEQLLRKIELEIRKAKETQILAKASGDEELVGEAQQKITQLTHKYRDILKASGLKSRLERARISQYRRVNVDKLK